MMMHALTILRARYFATAVYNPLEGVGRVKKTGLLTTFYMPIYYILHVCIPQTYIMQTDMLQAYILSKNNYFSSEFL